MAAVSKPSARPQLAANRWRSSRGDRYAGAMQSPHNSDAVPGDRSGTELAGLTALRSRRLRWCRVVVGVAGVLLVAAFFMPRLGYRHKDIWPDWERMSSFQLARGYASVLAEYPGLVSGPERFAGSVGWLSLTRSVCLASQPRWRARVGCDGWTSGCRGWLEWWRRHFRLHAVQGAGGLPAGTPLDDQRLAVRNARLVRDGSIGSSSLPARPICSVHSRDRPSMYWVCVGPYA
jgi:hypothetical protein